MQRVRLAGGAGRPGPTRSTARRARRCGSTSAGPCCNRRLNRAACATVPLPWSSTTPWSGVASTAHGSTRSSTRWSSGSCASGSSTTSAIRSPRRRRAARSRSPWCRPVRLRRLAGRARPRRRAARRCRRSPGAGARHRRAWTGLPLATAAGAVVHLDLERADEADLAALARLARRPGGREGHARRQGPAARAARPRLGTRRAHQRHGPGGLPRAARAAHLRPGGPGRALPRPRTLGPASAGEAQLRSTPTWTRPRPPGRARPQRSGDLADVLDASPGPARRRRAAAARSSCRWCTCWPTWSAAGIAVDRAQAWRASSRVRAADGARSEAQAHAIAGRPFNLGSPKQLQVILFDERGLPKTKRIKTGYTTDAEALAALFVADRAPAPGPPAAPGATPRGCGRPWQGCSPWSTPAAASTPPSTRPSRPPGGCPAPTRTCRTSRSAPRRAAGSAAASSSAPGTSSLMTADYSQIEMRIMAHLSEDAGPHRGVPLRRGPAHHGGVPGLRGPARRGGPRACGGGSRRCPTGWRTACPPSGCRSSSASRGTRRAASWTEYFARFGGVRDYLREIVDQARRHRLHRDDDGPPALPARPDQRQPPAPRDGRADGAQRADPGVGGRPHQGRDARRRTPRCAVPACAAGCCCRCTTSSCSRWRRGSGTQVEALVREAMGRRADLSVPAGGVGRRRADLGGRRATERGGATHPALTPAHALPYRGRCVAPALSRTETAWLLRRPGFLRCGQRGATRLPAES